MNTVLSHLFIFIYPKTMASGACARKTPYLSTPPCHHTKNNWLRCVWQRNTVLSTPPFHHTSKKLSALVRVQEKNCFPSPRPSTVNNTTYMIY